MTLDVWPALPIVIFGDGLSTSTSGADNIIAALRQNDRVCELDLWDVTSSQLEKNCGGDAGAVPGVDKSGT